MKWDILNQGAAVKTLLRAKPKGFLPLIANGKTPAGKGFLKSPKKLSDLVIADRVELSFMVDNAGIVPGERILILDVDGPGHLRADGTPSGVDGFASLAMWEKKFGEIPAETLTVETPSGGIQRYYLLPESRWGTVAGDSNLGAGELGLKETGLDVRSGDGCYAVLPGSTVPQGVYRWRDPVCPILPATDSLLKLVKSTGKPKKTKADTPERVCGDRTEEENRAMLEDVLSHITEPDYTTWEVIGAALAGEGFDKDVYVEWDHSNGAPSALDGPNSAESKWETFLHGVVPEGGAGVGTIFFYAKKYDPNFRIPEVFRRGDEIMAKDEVIAALMDDDEDGDADQDQDDQQDSAAPPGHSPWKDGKRLEKLEQYASKLLSAGMYEEQCWAEVMKANTERCVPPLEAEELEALHGQIKRWRYSAPDADRISAAIAKLDDYELFGDPMSASELGWSKLLSGILENAAYLVDAKSWCLFNGICWSIGPLSDARVSTFLMNFAEIMIARCQAVKDEAVRNAYMKRVGKLTQHNFRQGILKTLENLKAAASTDFDGENTDHLFCCQNGVLDLRPCTEGRPPALLPHDPAYKVTHCSPVSYDPTAEAARFERFIGEICVSKGEMGGYTIDAALASTLKKWCGCMLVGGLDLQKISLWYGPESRNGKSVLAGALGGVLGDYSTWINPQSLLKTGRNKSGSEASPDIMALFRRRALFSSEPDVGSIFSSDLLKRLSGADTIASRALYANDQRKEALFLRPNVLCNRLPLCDDSSLTRSGRALVIPFNRFFEEHEREEGLSQKLRTEGPGILRWMVEGLCEYYADSANGLKPFGPAAAPAVLEATAAYAQKNDKIEAFLSEYYDRTPGWKVLFSEVYSRYEGWAYTNHASTWRTDSFEASLEEHGLMVKARVRPSEGGEARKCVVGIKPKPPLYSTGLDTVKDKLMQADPAEQMTG